MIEIFVNECSFHEQLHDRQALVEAFRQYLTLLTLFNQRKAAYMLYYHENLFTVYRVTASELLIASLNNLPDKSMARAIKDLLFNKLNVQEWQKERLHSPDDLFICLEDVVTDTSMAELAERKLQRQEMNGLLLNFPHSKFTGLTAVQILKNEQVLPLLDCFDDKSALNQWLNDQLQSERFDYDLASSIPPTDLQTVLRDSQRFQPTAYYIQGRRVYREALTQLYWYVDNFHYGSAAHLEIFDQMGNHYGEANCDGLLLGNRDVTKRLRL